MTALQKVNLGTAPTGTDGDTVRTANVKANANVDVLNTQATLTSSSPNAVRDLTAADMGKRVNFAPTAASSVRFPAANTTGADQLVAVHNLSAAYDITMAMATGSGDTAPTIVVVKPGEMLTWETDGVSVWRTIGRKKAFDEVVQGKLTVAGALTTAAAVTAQSLAIGAVASISSAGAYSGVSATYSGAVSVGTTLGVTGQATFALRPTFAGNTPWDTGNLGSPMSRAPQVINYRQADINLGTPATNSYAAWGFTTSPLASAALSGFVSANITISPQAVPTSVSSWYLQIQLQKASDGTVVADSGSTCFTSLLTNGYVISLAASLAFSGLLPNTAYKIVVFIVGTGASGVAIKGQYNSVQGIVF